MNWNPAEMTAVLPEENAVLFFADLSALRKANLLSAIAGTKSVEELDYQKFVAESGFDYKSDLDRLVISFVDKHRYAVAVGRFNWQLIRKYAAQNGAECINAVCEIKGNPLENRISFYPLQESTMALASSPLVGGVYEIGRTKTSRKPIEPWPPQAPVWLRIPGSVWRDPSKLPTGAKLFASALGQAEQTIFTIQPAPDGKRLSLKMLVAGGNARDASKVLRQLEEATAMLRKMLSREGLSPKPEDLAGLLTKGAFRLEGNDRVIGEWPLEMALIQAIAQGNVE